VEKQTGSEKVWKLNQLRTNFEPAESFFGGKGVRDISTGSSHKKVLH